MKGLDALRNMNLSVPLPCQLFTVACSHGVVSVEAPTLPIPVQAGDRHVLDMWFQKENDRHGGFTVEFSPDFSEGEGRWWYSRIGSDTAPTKKGGSFHLKSSTG